MKKAIFGLMFVAATSAHAVDVGVSAGVNRSVDENVGVVTMGTSMRDFRFNLGVGYTVDTASSIGFSAGREMKLWSFTVTPQLGAAYLESDSKTLKSGGIITTGVNVAYPVTKKIAVTFDYARQWDIQSRTDFQGNVVTAGLRTSF